ncbi:HAD-IIA family hydrolase [bacterium]|nr:HAD-IIA family hydrolase [bacterium]MCB9477251.1 HAD-IIA family hydrolase [Deltaproteobacteria bacterium]
MDDPNFRLRDKKIAFMDIDGTLALGPIPIPGAKEFFDRLRELGLIVYLLSNNSSRSKADYVKKMAAMGIHVTTDEILLSTDSLVARLRKEGIDRAYVLGTRSFRVELEELGIAHDEDSMVIAMGYDTEITYEKIAKTAVKLHRGARMLVSHPDIVCPSPDGGLPDTGAMIEMFAAATGRRPEAILGKPSAAMVDHVIERHGVTPDDCFMLGDRIYTDFQMCLNVGMDFVAVLTGELTREDLAKFGRSPRLVVDSVAELLKL